jgi:hypothetical protein
MQIIIAQDPKTESGNTALYYQHYILFIIYLFQVYHFIIAYCISIIR